MLVVVVVTVKVQPSRSVLDIFISIVSSDGEQPRD